MFRKVDISLEEYRKIIKEKLEGRAAFLKTLSHPLRLCILYLLMEKGSSKVTDMQLCMEVSQSSVSQHIAKLKAAGIIEGERRGTEIYYSIPEWKKQGFNSPAI